VTNAQAVTADSDDAVVEKSKYIFTRKQGEMPRVVQANPSVSDPGVETRILKEIDYFDSEISSQQKEIGKLLNI
jgi:hypothetical protein